MSSSASTASHTPGRSPKNNKTGRGSVLCRFLFSFVDSYFPINQPMEVTPADFSAFLAAHDLLTSRPEQCPAYDALPCRDSSALIPCRIDCCFILSIVRQRLPPIYHFCVDFAAFRAVPLQAAIDRVRLAAVPAVVCASDLAFKPVCPVFLCPLFFSLFPAVRAVPCARTAAEGSAALAAAPVIYCHLLTLHDPAFQLRPL